ncbi:MAG: hypothetical protein P8P29_07810 [Flavobacteriaceae bacterium]|nr:hypothetical protein [Flavobacteriaceae bacterium]
MKAIDLAIVKALLDKSIPKVKDGVDGLDGSEGATGASGERGEQGKQGLSGKDGRDGLDGLNGADGSDGRDGKVGKRGERGLAGTHGLHGSNGAKGEKGKVGKQGLQGPKGDKGDTGKGIASIRVNEESMLIVTFDDGDMTIAGKMHFTKESNGGDYYTGAPLGSFGITGTKINSAGELVILCPWGKEFNTGFTGGGVGGGATNDWIKLATSYSSIPTFNTALLGGKVYNYPYNNGALTLFRYIAADGSDRYFQTFDGTTLGGLVATKAQTIIL